MLYGYIRIPCQQNIKYTKNVADYTHIKFKQMKVRY